MPGWVSIRSGFRGERAARSGDSKAGGPLQAFGAERCAVLGVVTGLAWDLQVSLCEPESDRCGGTTWLRGVLGCTGAKLTRASAEGRGRGKKVAAWTGRVSAGVAHFSDSMV